MGGGEEGEEEGVEWEFIPWVRVGVGGEDKPVLSEQEIIAVVPVADGQLVAFRDSGRGAEGVAGGGEGHGAGPVGRVVEAVRERGEGDTVVVVEGRLFFRSEFLAF